MLQKILLSFVWFPLTASLLIGNLFLLSKLSTHAKLSAAAAGDAIRVTASTYGSEQVLGASIVAGDARVLLLESFFRNHSSPMAEYATLIVSEADKNGLPFNLLPAIAMCESNLGKRVPLKAGFNPFGAAVYTGTLRGINFTSWSDAIIWESRYLKEKYFDQGIMTLTDIGAIYAPPSVENGNSWANCVGYFMSQLQ